MSVTILQGDVFARLKDLPDDSIDCVVTSPPYWGLRDYGVDGQIGMEPTLGEHLAVMVNVFAEIHRVLKPSGTVWLNYGDCYAAAPNGRKAADIVNDDRAFRDKPFSTIGAIYDPDYPARTIGKKGSKHMKDNSVQKAGRVTSGGILKPKDLCMIPNRLAIALQEWGWWVRSEIIWGKPNPMPESVTDRPATAHEKIWMLTKSARYFYDAGAVRQNAAPASVARWNQDIENQTGSERANGGAKTNGNMKAVGGRGKDKQRGHSRRHAGFNERWDGMTKTEQQAGGRHLKNYESAPDPASVEVWEIATAAFKEAHFATFPPALAERCILAGCPVGGTVLDPFGGAGTVGLVADRLERDAILIELNPEYVGITEKRLKKDMGLFTDIRICTGGKSHA